MQAARRWELFIYSAARLLHNRVYVILAVFIIEWQSMYGTLEEQQLSIKENLFEASPKREDSSLYHNRERHFG